MSDVSVARCFCFVVSKQGHFGSISRGCQMKQIIDCNILNTAFISFGKIILGNTKRVVNQNGGTVLDEINVSFLIIVRFLP
jgi:hypothetical protein